MDRPTMNEQTNIRSPLPTKSRPIDWFWPFWPLVPIYPYSKRRTLRTEVVKDSIWMFEQVQGIFYVVVPIRMTVIKLDGGGLLVYAPIAPTRECMRLMQELVAEHGDVQYIILPTVSGLEHKVFVGPFARQFPTAQVYVAPHQWSFPFNLPLSWLGLPGRRTQLLPSDSSQTPFADQFDYAQLGPIDLGLGPFEEVAFFHRRSQTLLVTDSLIAIPKDPPPIVQLDPYPLLFHAREDAYDVVEDAELARRKGWQRVVLFALYFRAGVLETVPLPEAFRQSFQAPDRSKKAYFGLYPFRWKDDWKQSFEVVRNEGRPLVAPILQTLILNRAPRETVEWADKIASWPFQRIIPCHFEAPIDASPQQVRQAFSFLRKNPLSSEVGHSLPPQDVAFLQELEEKLEQSRIVPPAKERT